MTQWNAFPDSEGDRNLVCAAKVVCIGTAQDHEVDFLIFGDGRFCVRTGCRSTVDPVTGVAYHAIVAGYAKDNCMTGTPSMTFTRTPPSASAAQTAVPRWRRVRRHSQSRLPRLTGV